MSKDVRLAILYGGQSPEHDVSCVSAHFVAKSALDAGFDVIPIGIRRDGGWVLASTFGDLYGEGIKALPSPDEAADEHCQSPMAALGEVQDGYESGSLVVFPLVHGPKGEDGTLQGLCEVAGLPYVGAGVLGSSTAMDKGVAKELFSFHEIPQTAFVTLAPTLSDGEAAKLALASLPKPLYVKPANLGSSVGITRVEKDEDLEAAIGFARRYDTSVIVEAGVFAREVEIAVLGDAHEGFFFSLPGEIQTGGTYYSYEEKYESDSFALSIPAELESLQLEKLRDLADKACRALRVDGMARVDCFVTKAGEVLVNEINTIPGFTPISMYPKLMTASGIPPATLVARLVALGQKRFERERQRSLRHQPVN